MTDPVLQVVPLGAQWPTIDPFLFCAHHDDAFPAGNADLGPDAPLTGRQLGSDFSGRDGWSMYHGQVVPGFPRHPHRGFETITYVRSGLIDHSDSLGAAARFGEGDVQWMTAGKGIVHAEMFPLLNSSGANPAELFQIWLNLPAADKMVEPHFSMLWSHDLPSVRVFDDAGAATEIVVIAGALQGAVPPASPPASYASRPEAELEIWHLRLEPGARFVLPPATEGVVRTLYVFEGGDLAVGSHQLGVDSGAVLRIDEPVALTNGNEITECLVLGGRPIGEPVAQYGPFVLNDEAGIRQAFADYERTEFGGWPWPSDAPVHGDASRGRFARHNDGRLEELTPQPVD